MSATESTQSVMRKKLMRDFLVGGLAACCAVTMTNPLEVVKIRMQLQGELQLTAERQYRNVFHAFSSIVQKDGIIGLQKGLRLAYMTQFALNGTRLGLYPNVKKLLGGDNPDASYLFLRNGLAGSISGTMAAYVSSPIDLIKTRFQAQSQSINLGHTYKYDGIIDAFRTVWRNEGIRGFYRGGTAAAMRVCVGSGVQLGTYDQAKAFLISSGMKDDIKCYLGASLMSGFIMTTAMNPFDVIRTRLYNQKVDIKDGAKGALYSGPIQCAVKTIKSEGFLALYKGWGVHYLRLGPHTALTLIFWEFFSKLFPKI